LEGGVPERDKPTPEAPAPADIEAPETEEETTEKPEAEAPRKSWSENFNVKKMTEIETIDRLRIIVGVNEYKGSHLVFIAKVTDKDFSRHFFSMPAWVWNKTVPILSQYGAEIGTIEKEEMAKKVLEELKRLKELGIDVGALASRV